MNELISVIVPVYNVENYLEKCLYSLLNQTYSNIQIVLIDDGSTDKSGKICDSYLEKDKRIVVYHTSNRGVSSARNLGLANSKGKYIYFLDPDDYLEVDALEKLHDHIEKFATDLVQCSYYKNYLDKKSEVVHSRAEISKQKAIQSLLRWDGYITSFCWDKLFKRERIGDTTFKTNLKVGEDDLFVFEYLLKCEKVSVIDDPLYNYLIRTNSAIGNIYTAKMKDSVKAASAIFELCDKDSVMKELAKLHVGLSAFFSCANLLDTIPREEFDLFIEDRKFYIDKMSSCHFNVIKRETCTKIAVLYKMVQYCPRVYRMTGAIRNKKR